MKLVESIILSTSVNTILTYGFLISIVIFIGYIYASSKDSATKFHLIDIISNPDGTASLSRVLQFAAGVTATWVIIKMTILGVLSTELFITYLAAMGVSEGFSKYIAAKYNANSKSDAE